MSEDHRINDFTAIIKAHENKIRELEDQLNNQKCETDRLIRELRHIFQVLDNLKRNR
ncbi:hypothetical protein [Aerococcus urinae]|uniref:hypothetical protein n=1 Tax=Aerococcus urinae TaxID=1376 RepID=UPI00254D63DF|nr:hypothetical protein [Aerococcus urinae]MDK7716063.1 hypothetical protein [Aerococcus urinae]